MATTVDSPEHSRFEIFDADELAGFAEYQRSGRVVIFTHTEIDPAFEGRGLASQLIRFALDSVAAADGAIVPLCPFVAAFVGKHPEYQHLVIRAGKRSAP